MAYIGKQPAVAALTASDITDGIVSNAKLAQDIISADTALGAEPADTDEFLVSDAGTLKRMDYSHIKGGGKVLQVVTTNSSTAVDCTSSTYADLISADITPSNTANKIIAWFNTAAIHQEEAETSTIDYVRLVRDATEVKEIATFQYGINSSLENIIYPNLCVLDAPSSTSLINYSIQVKRNDNTYNTSYGYGSGTNCISLILMEIDGT